jgi:hypothetical protein
MSKEEALNTARRLVQEAVDVAGRAGIGAASVVAPHCSEAAAMQDGDDDLHSKNLTWGGVPGIVVESTEGLFDMPEPDEDPEQKPAFLVTPSTADLVQQDFERYEPSLERMAEDWQEKKARVLSEAKSVKE